jgi:hypothetical protein
MLTKKQSHTSEYDKQSYTSCCPPVKHAGLKLHEIGNCFYFRSPRNVLPPENAVGLSSHWFYSIQRHKGAPSPSTPPSHPCSTVPTGTSQKLLRYTFLALMYLIVVLPSCQLALFCHQTDMTESLFVLLITFPEGSSPNSGQEPQVLVT